MIRGLHEHWFQKPLRRFSRSITSHTVWKVQVLSNSQEVLSCLMDHIANGQRNYRIAIPLKHCILCYTYYAIAELVVRVRDEEKNKLGLDSRDIIRYA